MHEWNAQLVYPISALVGEGCFWDVTDQVLYWVDILGSKVYRYDPSSHSNTGWYVGEHVGCLSPREKGGLILALRSGFAFLDTETGDLEKIVDPEPGLDGNRFNDGKTDPQGNFWAGTMAYDLTEGAGSLYCVSPGLEVSTKLKGVTLSNGLVWSTEGSTFYFIDSSTQCVRAYPYDAGSQALGEDRLVVEFSRTAGIPDGMTIDSEGFLWVALWEGARVVRIDPSSGSTVGEVHVPADLVTSCCFGGEALNELYITTADFQRPPQKVEDQPLAGSLFKVSLPFAGLPAARFRG